MIHMVMHVANHKRDGSKAITVRIARDDYERLRKHAVGRHASLNSVVAEAIAQYTARQERAEAIQMIREFQAHLRETRAEGIDSVKVLHEIREMRCQCDRSGDMGGSASDQSGRLQQHGEEKS